jgi:eukaryotic-like serine/threonine-protein kinase
VITRFGAYEILYELKTGGMGAVLLGRRRGPGTFEQLVAIKTILASFAQTPAVRAMFLDEAAILARLNHPAIATVHDFGEQGGALYMVLEYVAGIPFRDVMEHGLPPTIAARAIAEACRGVHAAHELRDLPGHLLGVVHRDISPDNLMFGFDGHIKVIDFGIALVKNRQAPVTEMGMLKGKPPYMSPEHLKNEAIDRRSDVFSLAVVLWEMLTGRALFGGDSLYAIALAVEQQEISPPSEVLGEALPRGLDEAVMAALVRDPSRRTQTAAALAEQLELVVQGAGDETLEAWAERDLADRRVAHRAWLARVVAGTDTRGPIGRATGAVTALAPIGKTPAVDAAGLPSTVDTGPGASVSIDVEAHDELDVPPRRRIALPLLVGAIAIGMVVGGIAFVLRAGAPGPPGRDAGVAVPADAVAVPADAVVVAPVDADATPRDAPVDAGVVAPVDAGPRRRTRAPQDAGRALALDAGVTTTSAPASTAGVIDAAPAGWGALTAKHKGGSYLNVVLDGRMVGPTPMFNQRIPAGTHVIELVDVKTGDVVVRRTVTVDAGQGVLVVEPDPK